MLAMKRMHGIATGMLLLAAAGSIIAWPYRGGFSGGLVFAACEASLVGALADWFAVVALFRHPLGLRFIPHTAIIPNNRGRIIEGIVKIVETDWLSLDFIQTKLHDYPIIDGVGTVLETEEGRRGMERVVQSLIINTLEHLQPEAVARFVHLMLVDNLGQIKIAPALVERLESSVKNLYGEDLIRLFLEWGIAATKGEEFERAIKRTLTRAAADYSNRGNFIRRLGKGLGESLDIVNYDEASETISHRIRQFLIEMKDPGNQYHLKIKSELDKLQIADPASAAIMLGELLQRIIKTEAGFAATVDLIATLKTQLLEGSGAEKLPLISYIVEVDQDQRHRNRCPGGNSSISIAELALILRGGGYIRYLRGTQ